MGQQDTIERPARDWEALFRVSNLMPGALANLRAAGLGSAWSSDTDDEIDRVEAQIARLREWASGLDDPDARAAYTQCLDQEAGSIALVRKLKAQEAAQRASEREAAKSLPVPPSL